MRKRTIKYCINHALKKLSIHPDNKFFHYSFIVVNDSIISVGMNFKTSAHVPKGFGYHELGYVYTDGKTYGPTTHSEVNAYNKAKGLLSDNQFEILNLRFNKSGELKMSQPCSCCHQFLRVMGCRCAYFSTDIGIAKIRM